MEGAVRGLYDECGLTVPDRVQQAIRGASGPTELVELLADVRLLLANQPALRGPRGLYAAINGFKHATEPACQLVSPRANTFASIDMDFGIGIELEGVGATPWMLYQVEYRTASGCTRRSAGSNRRPVSDEVSAPAGACRGASSRVILESPAEGRACARTISSRTLTAPRSQRTTSTSCSSSSRSHRRCSTPRTGLPIVPDRTFTFRRGNGKPFTLTIKGGAYTPASRVGSDPRRGRQMGLRAGPSRVQDRFYLRIYAIETRTWIPRWARCSRTWTRRGAAR